MSLLLDDFDRWYEIYEAASIKQQYELLMAAIAQPIPLEFAEDVDLGILLVDMQGHLASNNQIDAYLAFVDALVQHQPELYQKKEYPYFDDVLVDYYLYRNEPEQVRAALARFRANPVPGIDPLLELLKGLEYAGESDLVLELCRAVYKPVQTSSELFSGIEGAFGHGISIGLLDRAYQTLQAGEPVDWEGLLAETVQYGMEDDRDWLAEIQHGLTVDLEIDGQFFDDFQRHPDKTLHLLMLHFCRSMTSQKQTGFLTSHAIWAATVGFLHSLERSRKQQSHPDKYFAFKQRALERYVNQQMDSFLLARTASKFGFLWGMPYVYDFLVSKGVIAEEIRDTAIAIAAHLKAQLIERYDRHLWRYNFVHRWLPPDSISEADFEAEAAQFVASIEQVTPLSEEPGQSFFASAKKLVGDPELDNVGKGTPDSADTATVVGVQSPAAASQVNFKFKPKKSPLQLAKELYAQDNQKKTGKKKQSGKKKRKHKRS